MTNPTDKPITPLPYWQMASISMVQLCEAVNVTILFPFMAFMIEDMGYTGSQLGYYVGGLAATFCGAQFSSSVLWGMFSDKYGRKLSIIIGTLGTAIGMLIFGTAKVYPQAIMGRFIGGFLCGNLGVMKSFLTEITDDTNRGHGFALLSVFWAIGNLFAPLVGGLLSNPTEKYPQIFSKDSLFGYFPYLLPCVLCACLNVISVVMCAITMKESKKFKPLPSSSSPSVSSKGGIELTNQDKAGRKNKQGKGKEAVYSPLTNTDDDGDRSNISKPLSPIGRNTFVIRDEDDEDDEENEDRTDDEVDSTEVSSRKMDKSDLAKGDLEKGSYAPLKHNLSAASNLTDKESDDGSVVKSTSGDSAAEQDDSDEICCATLSCQLRNPIFFCCGKSNHDATLTESSHGMMDSSNGSSSSPPSTGMVLRRRGVIMTTGSYGLLAMAYILFDETIPLFLKLDKHLGGFSFGSSQIGTLLSVSGGFMLLFTSFVLPKVASRSKKWMYEIGIIGSIPITLSWPLLATLNAKVLLHIHDNLTYLFVLWPLLLLVNICKNICACLCFTAVMIQVNHSAEEEYLGSVNGLGQSLAALARAIGPAFGGLLWSLSIQYHFVFLNFLGVIIILCFCGYINRLLPASIDFKKKSKHAIDTGKGNVEDDDEVEGNLGTMEMMH